MSDFNEKEGLLDGARVLRGVLPELIDEGSAALDAQLAALLESSSKGEDVHERLLKTVASHEETRIWMAQHLGLAMMEKAYRGLPGHPNPVPAPRYDCPKGDYSFFRRSVAVPLPKCPTHKLKLVKVP